MFKLNMNFVSNAIVCLFDFLSLNLCLHFLVLFLFCHPYLISSLFWNCLLETNGLSNYIEWITCLSKHLDKLEKKDNDIISAYLHVPLCLFPDTFFIFVQRWSNKWQAEFLCNSRLLKFIYSEKATKFCKIFPLLLTLCTVVKSKGKIAQNFVAFSEYMNFTH